MKTELENMEVLRLSNEESNKITRECLRVAMFKLMNQESFEKITVTELAKRAGVSRVAFYRNYDSKEALVADICQSVFNELKASLTSQRFLQDRNGWYTAFFRTIRDNSEYFQIYLNANLKLTDGLVLEAAYPGYTPEEHYARAASEGAFLNVLTEWFQTGMQESPEEMAGICERVIEPAIRTQTTAE